MSKKNTKLLKKVKPETLIRYLQFDEKLNSQLKIGTSAIKKRWTQLLKSTNARDLKLKQVQDDLNQFKEVVLYYHKGMVEEHHGKEEIFRNVIQMPYSNKTNRLEVLQREMERIKSTEAASHKHNLNTNAKADDHNWSQLTVSPVLSKPEANCLYQLQSKRSVYPTLAHIAQQPQSPNHSLNNSTDSISDPLKPARFFKCHSFDQKTVSNKICNECFKKESCSSRQPSKAVHTCRRCGMYLHESCRSLDSRQICIPLSKSSLKVTGERTLDLAALVHSSSTVPLVPGLLLALMHHIQTFGRQTPDLYRATGCDKNVRDLCDKLMDGKAKSISQFDVLTSGNCLRLVLRSLKAPLLSDGVILELSRAIDRGDAVESAMHRCMDSMTKENRDTLVYLVVHLKVIAETPGCRLDLAGLASVFMPSITSVAMSSRDAKGLVKLVQAILEIDYEFYDDWVRDNSLLRRFFPGQAGMASNSLLLRA